MANLIYLTIRGKTQGLISAGCSSDESIGSKSQQNHKDEIFVYSFDHELSYIDNIHHHPVSITKPIDKSTPLLSLSISEGEILQCELSFYRTSPNGGMEKYYYIKLTDAKILSISTHFPHSLTHNDQQPYEQLQLSYKCIDWKNLACKTYGHSFWQIQQH